VGGRSAGPGQLAEAEALDDGEALAELEALAEAEAELDALAVAVATGTLNESDASGAVVGLGPAGR